LVGGKTIVAALGVHDVAHLETKTAQGRDLFGTQDATDLYFGLNAHPQLCGLRGRELVDALFDEVFIRRIGVESLVERDVCLAHTLVRRLSFVTVFGDNPADRLTLIGRQTKLFNRIWLTGRKTRILLGQHDGGGREENH
jgi:hypothetical protein